MGHLIPAGVGFPSNRAIRLVPLAQPVEEGHAEEAKQDGANRLLNLLK